MLIRRYSCLLLVACNLVARAAPTDEGLFAVLATSMGNIAIALDMNDAPRTTANFVGLVEGSRPWIDPRDGWVVVRPYYDGLTFHRVVSNFVIQAGSPQGTGTDGPGYQFADEFSPALRHDAPGVVSMANAGPHSNGGQFFITVTATPWLDDRHSVFGRVVEGMDVVYAISGVAVNTQAQPLVDVVITQAVIVRRGSAAEGFSADHAGLPRVEPAAVLLQHPPTLSLAVSGRVHAAFYRSTNVVTWTRYRDHYRNGSAGIWVTNAPDADLGFFFANRVDYAADTNTPLVVTGRHMHVILGATTIQITGLGGPSATIQVSPNPASPVTTWEWTWRPFRGGLYIESLNYQPILLDLWYDGATGGRSRGFFRNSGFWFPFLPSGYGSFTDVPWP